MDSIRRIKITNNQPIITSIKKKKKMMLNLNKMDRFKSLILNPKLKEPNINHMSRRNTEVDQLMIMIMLQARHQPSQKTKKMERRKLTRRKSKQAKE